MMKWAERLEPGLSPEGQAQTLSGEGMIVMIYPTEAQNRDYLSQWHEQCERARSLFNHDLRRRLEKLAQNGHVMARYLYASWKPSMTIDSGVFERTTRWHLNATDFSYANLEEGELAGMIAIGESYIYGGFTSHNLRLGLFTLRAASEYEHAAVDDGGANGPDPRGVGIRHRSCKLCNPA